jgi:hypothetical protein
MAGKAVYLKITSIMGGDAAKAYLYGGDAKLIEDALFAGSGGSDKFTIDKKKQSDPSRQMDESFYKNGNGLEVKFYPIGGLTFYQVMHTSSNFPVQDSGVSWGSKKETLKKIESVSSKLNFRMPLKAIQAADPGKVVSILKGLDDY